MSDLELLLAAVERRSSIDPIFCGKMRELITDAQGLPSPTPRPPEPLPQPYVAPEFPQWRVKYTLDFKEVTRVRVESFTHFGELVKENPLIVSWTPVPIERSR